MDREAQHGCFPAPCGRGQVNTELLTTHRFKAASTDAYNLILNRAANRFAALCLQYRRRRNIGEVVKLARRKPCARRVGIGLIGAGNFARGVLLPVLRRSAKSRLVGIATATGISARNTGEQFGFAYSTTDVEKILNDRETHCVVIATRHDTHARLASDALRQGKAVFVEKPLAINEEELREVVAAARQSSGLLMVGYNRRFAPIAKEIKAHFENRSGPMTILYRVNAGQLPPEHWRLMLTKAVGVS